MRGLHPPIAAVLAVVLLTGCAPDPAPEATTTAPVATTTTPTAPSITPDPYAGYFAGRAGAEMTDHLVQFYDSFGDPGGIAPRVARDETLDPGDYVATISCAGTHGVDVVAVSVPGAEQLAAVTVACSEGSAVSTTVPFTVTGVGVEFAFDSHREPGAYLLQIDRAA